MPIVVSRDMHRVRTVCVAACLIVGASASGQTPKVTPTNATLARMRARIDSIGQQKPFNFPAYQAVADSFRPVLFNLIERDSLRTGADFFVASSLVFDPFGFFESRRVEHEMALAALVAGQPGVMQRLGFTWDGLNLSMGLGQRIGSYQRNGVASDMDPVPSPPFLRAVFRDFASARARATAATNKSELQALRDADQADREDPIDQAKMERMSREDPKRRARVLELITAGAPATGRDFQNAATVLQHGDTRDDFRLAHELSVAAFALGDTSALWLVPRTYDRLLLHMGHRQRFATQFRGIKLQPIDTVAMSDRIRALVGGRKLADVRAGAHP